jgi:transposase
MRDNDGRRLDHATLEAMRLQAVREVVEGALPAAVAAALGLNRSTVFGWVARYRDGGAEALKAKEVPGRPTKLSHEAMLRLYSLVVGTDPRRLGFGYALWTRATVRMLIAREFGVALSTASVGRLLRSLGLWSLQPMSAADQPDAGGWSWIGQYPKVRAEAAAAGATLFLLRENTISSKYDPAPANLVYAVSVAGTLRFAGYSKNLTARVVSDFCTRLRHDVPGPAVLMVGGHPVYRSPAVSRFVDAHGWLRICQLPVLSPLGEGVSTLSIRSPKMRREGTAGSVPA